ncbi:MAG: hypothetical protein J6D34_04900 [Atopobiaceae bacterium]|nr:hypothetical protein [Atopobiaceae bacterium]
MTSGPIGDRCQFGPNVTTRTAEHSFDAVRRARDLQYNLPVRIGNDVWVVETASVTSR